jgi:SNF2 family DNA or RNA helicase
VEIEVELSPAERKMYANLVKHSWAVTSDKEITTSNALDKNTRLEQLASDWGALDSGLDAGAKVKAAVELIHLLLERDEQVVVFAKYKETVRRIHQALVDKGVTALQYHGDIDPHDRDVAVTAFGNGKCAVIVGTLKAMSEGVDGLQQASSTIVMVDRWWTHGKNDQAIGRLRRSGQAKVVTVYHVFAKDTVDATISAACLRKLNVVELLKGRPAVDAIYGRI